MGYPEAHWCQTCCFGSGIVAIVCALELCKFTSDGPRSANDSSGYFKWGKLWFGIWKGWERHQLLLALKKKKPEEAGQLREGQRQTQ